MEVSKQVICHGMHVVPQHVLLHLLEAVPNCVKEGCVTVCEFPYTASVAATLLEASRQLLLLFLLGSFKASCSHGQNTILLVD